jgi:hypothetical protein
MLDGRPMNDPVTGTYNLYDMPLEFIDHVEIFSGSKTNIAADQQGVALNIISRSYNSLRPVTKLRFVQDPKGTILTDGIFTQNIARGLNLMIGFQRHVTQGRYFNAELDAWNVRTRLRYNISDRLNIALTDFYTKAVNGLNGGVDILKSIEVLRSIDIFDETSNLTVNRFSFDKRSRHDLTLSTIARLFSDSASTTQASIYYSKLDREFWNPPDLGYPYNIGENIDDSTKASFWGMRLQQQISLPLVYLVVGGQWERRKSDSTRTLPTYVETEKSLFMQAELRLTNIIMPSVSLRSISMNGVNTLNSGIGIKSEIGGWVTLFADATWFDRFPTIQERCQIDSTIMRGSGDILKEQHTLLQAGFDLHIGSNLRLNITGYEREVKNAIVYLPETTGYGSPAIRISNLDDVKLLGLNGSIILRLYNFELSGAATLTRYKQSDTIKTLFPDVILGGELSYRDKFFNEKLDAKFGARSRFYNRQQGMRFDPQTLSYFQYKGGILGRTATIDLFMILKIGDAHLSLTWENILDAGYYFTPIYPMPGRHIRVGVNWIFTD